MSEQQADSIQTHLIEYLPAIYQEDLFIQNFLKAFEVMLLGKADDNQFPAQGFEQTIDRLDRLFDPQQTPDEFLEWLSSWTALSLQADLTREQQRAFITQIIPLYQRRGTRENLEKLLKIFTQSTPTVIETGGAEFQIGISSRVGAETIIGGSPPHTFNVKINLFRLTEAEFDRQVEIARALIDLEKPAHTNYKLTIELPALQIGKHSTVGVDTFLGTQTDPKS